MRTLMIKRLLIVAAILLAGFVINVFVYDLTFTPGSATQNPQNGCVITGPDDKVINEPAGPPVAAVDIGVSAGEPFKTNSSVKLPPTEDCGVSVTQLTFHLSDFISDWQFYANWLVWSLPLFGVAYVISSRYAHSGH